MNVLRSLVFYAVFYLGTAVLVLAALLAMAVVPRWLVPLCDSWSDFHHWCVENLLGIEVRIIGAPQQGAALYAIKHEAFFEAIELAHLFDYPSGFAKKELFSIPGWGHTARTYGMIPVARGEGAKALRSMLGAARPIIEQGRPIIIFPEGTRVPHGERRRLQSGFAALYKLMGLPVVPVAVDSGPLYHRLWKRKGVITISFGEVIEPGLPRPEIEARVHAAINALNAPEIES